MRIDLPSGTVTFLFTDVEGSTRLLAALGAEAYAGALASHREVIRGACAANGGVEVDTQGDAFFFAFPTASGALQAAAQLTQDLHDGPLSVRVGIHTGTPLLTEEGYVGHDLHRAARIAAAGHGGQVLVSASTASLLDASNSLLQAAPLQDLGEHRFRDLQAPERVFQLGGGEFPALKSLYRTNLPVPATAFLGRERELHDVVSLVVREDVRLLTLTGPGGTGKTRLALQAAAEAAEHFPDGVWWVALAPLRDPEHVLPALLDTLGVQDDSQRSRLDVAAEALAGRRSLLLLDNAEHLLPDIADVTEALLTAAPTIRLVVPSRERFKLEGEHVFPVPPLESSEAVAMFVARARALDPAFGESVVLQELCERLDNLPLAIELAAARTTVFTPEQLLERIGQRLDVLKAGRRADPRHETLRATVQWSYDLLDRVEQVLFARLAVFTGGGTYEAAEALCAADPDALQSLLDKSLLRRRVGADGRPRYWMLETIREFAAERLTESGEEDGLRAAHAHFYAELLARQHPAMREGDETATATLEEELANARAGLALALDGGDEDVCGMFLLGLWFYWLTRGLNREAVAAVDRYLELDSSGSTPAARFGGTVGASEVLRYSGHAARALGLKRELLYLARADPELEVFGTPVCGGLTAAILTDLAHVELELGGFEAARSHAVEALELRRVLGMPGGIAHALGMVSMVALAGGQLDEAYEAAAEGAALWEETGADEAPVARVIQAELHALCGRLAEAASLLVEYVPAIPKAHDIQQFWEALRVSAMVFELLEKSADALALATAAFALQDQTGFSAPFDAARLDEAAARASASLTAEAATAARSRGEALTAEQALELAVSLLSELEARIQNGAV